MNCPTTRRKIKRFSKIEGGHTLWSGTSVVIEPCGNRLRIGESHCIPCCSGYSEEKNRPATQEEAKRAGFMEYSLIELGELDL